MMASMMAAVISAVVIARIIRRTIIDTPVVIISVTGITTLATIVAGPVKPRNASETNTEVLRFGVDGDYN
jgi:hypothetical protein